MEEGNRSVWLSKSILVILCLSLSLLGSGNAGASIGNSGPTLTHPAAIYCNSLGYDYVVEVNDKSGKQDGFCIFPDETKCEQWDFYSGVCGKKFSYCEQNGYITETRKEGEDPFSPVYAVCVLESGKVVGTVAELSGLTEATIGCSDCFEKDPNTPGYQPTSKNVPEDDDGDDLPGAPASFDWRNYSSTNWMTSVKNQGGCGSCWAFAALGTVEAHKNIVSANPALDLDLSEQEIVSCSIGGTCEGGHSYKAFQYIRDCGVVDEINFLYAASDLACPYNDVYPVDGCPDWPYGKTFVDGETTFAPTQATLKQAIEDQGPVVVYLGVGAEFGAYWDGDIYRCTDDSSINHAVVAVGWGW